jgi:predicted RNA-binding protein with PUA-like domain
MAYWLLKTEPDCYSYEDLEKDKKTVWDGVANNLALKYLRQMKKGDLALIYHTGDVRAVIGVAEVTSNAYVDPKENDPKLAVVDVKPKRRLGKPVSLAEIKSTKGFEDFLLVKMGRLSVLPVTGEQWKKLTGE